jgi:excisionase family DNA binding protein
VETRQDLPSFLTETQAAEYLQVSLSTLRRWRRARTSPTFFRLGGVIRFSREALQTFIQNHTVQVAQ